MIDNEIEIVQLYQNGHDIRKIAEMIGKSYESIRQVLIRNKVRWRKKFLNELSQQEVDKILEGFDNGKSIAKIANEFEISAPAISRFLNDNNRVTNIKQKKYNTLRTISINPNQEQLIVGTLLGDGCLYRSDKRHNYRLCIGQCEKQSEYFIWKYEMLQPFINTYHTSIDKRGNSVMLQASTIVHPQLNKFGNMFYPENGKKIVPKNLDMWFTPIALTAWILDDGNLNAGVNLRISTHGFSYEDHLELQSLLKRVFDVRSKIAPYKHNNKEYFYLSVNKENTLKISNIIRPFTVECMKYKLMSISSETTCQTPEGDEDIVRPTMEIVEPTGNE